MAFLYHAPRHSDGNYCVFPGDMRTWEKREIDQITNRGRELMEIAGREVALHVLNHYPNIREALIFCGTGNNGGDALVAAYYLERCGLDIHLFGFEDNIAKTPDAQTMFKRVNHLPRTILRQNSDASKIREWERRKDVIVIDGIFGTGYHPAHNILMSCVYQNIAHLACPVVSIDVPSGIDASTGFRGTMDDANPPKAIMATDTITFGAPKVGHFIGEGPTYTGELYCSDIGLNPWPNIGIRGQILSDAYCQKSLFNDFTRALDVHKGRCGHVTIVGGDTTMQGAVFMAAKSALRSGCGLVTAAMRCASHGPDEVMTCQITDNDGRFRPEILDNLLEKTDILLVGPGLGRDDTADQIFHACCQFKGCMICDADALWSLAKSNAQIHATECLVTPHPTEAARLLDIPTKDILYHPFESAHKIAEKYGVTAIVKSHATVIASKKSNAFKYGLLPYPNPAMATAGSGDVLAGILSGILAQSRCGAVSRWFDAFEVAAMAVNLHSQAGRRAAKPLGNAVCASDIIQNIVTTHPE